MDSIALERATVAPPATRPDLRRRWRRLGLAAALFAAATGLAWYAQDWWRVGRFIESTDDAYVGGNVTPLAPHIDAFIEQVLVTDNERVAAGQLLIRLDQRDYRAALDHAEASLAARLAAAESLRAQSALQQSTIRQQEADLVAKNAGAAFAAEDASRYRFLAQATVGSRQNEQRSAAADQEARAAVVAGRAGLEAAQQQIKVLDAQIAEADAAVAQANSELRTAELNLGYSEIRAPTDGYVGNRAAQIGAYATRGTYLISVTPADGLWVDANFKEDQLARMLPGQSASVTADALPGHVFRGHVASFAPGTGAVFSVIPPENATGNFTKIVQRVAVRIALDGGDPMLATLRPGLSTIVRVETRGEKGAP
ncbi:MAG TPA: HlyD family secretion protein [Stellaceae bacterium]|jgi:membrane fusion protein (multidrug efflux system)|nr:HlyD family secretion protein [Stellaceae bacterium]